MASKAASFRMTLWFKKGELDEPAGDDDAPSARLLPIDDRYLDDGSLTSEDTRRFGLHSGQTQHVAVVADPVPEQRDGERELRTLMRELKRGRRTVLAMLGATAVALGGVLALVLS